MRTFLLWFRTLCACLVGMLFAGVVRADDPTYTGTTFDGLQTVMDDTSLFFGAVVALAVIVTSFFLGRRWLRSVG